MLERLKKIFKEDKLRKELAEKQEEINQQYAKEGLTDNVLEKQVALNELRNALDISDETKRIYENFVQ